MQFSSVVRAAAAIAALALAACGGANSGSLAAPSVLPAAAQPAAGKSPCDLSNGWYFHGSCITGTLTQKGGHFALPAYKGISFDVTLGHNNAQGKLKFVFGDATGGKDITGKKDGKPFPLYGKHCLNVQSQPTTCTGKPVIYTTIVNPSPDQVFLSGSATIVITDASGYGKATTCFPSLLAPKGWYLSVQAGVTPVGTKVTINIPGGSGFNVLPGQTAIAIVCQ